MPNLGPLHPQVVHFVVALGLVGVLFRLLSLFWRRSWLAPAATTLIVLTAGASVVAVKSGTDAHGVAERIPGARDAVIEHEEWGERTRNLLLALAGLELLTLAFASKPAGRALQFGAALGGLAAAGAIYQASDLGGDLVYNHAGGVGTRSGNPDDITNLLVAGLYHAARSARDSGRAETAARLIDELTRARPGDTSVWMLAAESRIRDRRDPAAALAVLDSVRPPAGSRFDVRHGLLESEARAALGQADTAKMVLEQLLQRHPDNRAVKEALAKLP
jgi:uncharacterized membrane protein